MNIDPRTDGLKTRYTFIHFIEVGKKAKTSVWECRNNRSSDVLGKIMWYAPWRQYCFFPTMGDVLVFNVGCLGDISNFIMQLRGRRQ